MRTSLFIVIIWLLIPHYSLTQPLFDIRFEGISKHNEEYLKRNLRSKLGQDSNSVWINEDLRQLGNLPSIAKVTYRIDTTLASQLILVFEIEEAITLFPILNFGGIRGNVWFQAGFKELNLNGKGHQLALSYRNTDRRHNGELFFKIPYLNNSAWGYSLSLLRWASVEPLYFGEQAVFYNYNNTSLGFTFIHNFSPNHQLEFGATYFVEKYQKNQRHLQEITPGPELAREPKLLYKFTHQIGKISYHHLMPGGWDNTFYAQRIWNINSKDYFNIVFNDTRFFKRIGRRINFATRLRLGISTNNDSPFAPFVLDSHVNIRGSGNRIDRGTAMAVLNLEYRHILFELDRFAFQAVAFSDLGSWRQPGGAVGDLVKLRNVKKFAGGGIRIIYKRAHNASIRIDYGSNLRNGPGSGLVLGFGQYF